MLPSMHTHYTDNTNCGRLLGKWGKKHHVTELSCECGIDLSYPGNGQLDLAAVAGVRLVRVTGVEPKRVAFKINCF